METKTRVITAHVPLPLAKKIDKMAEQMDRPRGWIIKQALAQWIDDEEYKYQGTLKALAEIDAGKGIPHEEIEAWVKTLGKKK